MGIACSCLKDGNYELNAHQGSPDVDRRVIMGRKNYSSGKEEARNENRNKLNPSRILLEAHGDMNEIKRPRGLLIQHSSPISDPFNDDLSPPSAPSPHSTSPPLSSLSSSPRISTEIVREFAERIGKRILSIGREREDGIEIAWFCERERGTKEGVEGKEGDEGGEVKKLIEVVGAEEGNNDVEWKGKPGMRREKNARWKVLLAERPSVGGSNRLVECDEGNRNQVKEEEANEEIDQSGETGDTIVVISEENEEVWMISRRIALIANKFGGIREDSTIVVV